MSPALQSISFSLRNENFTSFLKGSQIAGSYETESYYCTNVRQLDVKRDYSVKSDLVSSFPMRWGVDNIKFGRATRDLVTRCRVGLGRRLGQSLLCKCAQCADLRCSMRS